ncbi:hypothetical protein CPAV1605_1616 [seawater metagenome]|uniref:EamA domain-containing protein n=1 Tax=seawater metagenome TaxID=1561972 RepID=A0A5E8CKZ8_9ZZZZ
MISNTEFIFPILTGFFYAFTYALTKNKLNLVKGYGFTDMSKSIYILLLSNFWAVILLLIYFFIFCCSSLDISKIISNINFYKWTFLIGINSTLGTYFLYRSINNSPISTSVPIIGGSLFIFIILLAIFYNKDKVGIDLYIGLALLLAGILTIYKQEIIDLHK